MESLKIQTHVNGNVLHLLIGNKLRGQYHLGP